MKRTQTWKKNEVQELSSLLKRYKVLGVADMTSMPSLQLQRLRSDLRGVALIRMSKGNLITLAFSSLKSSVPGLDELEKYVRGMPALVLTNESPFKLAATLKKSKSKASAKTGQLAPHEIYVEEGSTSFPPGPVIGELGSFGIKTSIEEGKIVIKARKLLVKEGEMISSGIANILSRLGIEPMEIGINLLATLENGEVLTRDVLFIDEEVYANNLRLASQDAFALALGLAWPLSETLPFLLQRADREAVALAKASGLPTKETIGEDIAVASLYGETLMSKVQLPPKGSFSTEDIKEEKNVEEKKEEVDGKVKEEPLRKDSPQEEAKIAQEILKRLQDEKLKSFKVEKPDEPKIHKGPEVGDLVGDR